MIKSLKLLILVYLALGYLNANAQTKKRVRKVKKYYFVTASNDTTHCKKLEWSTLLNGKLSELKYTTLDGKKVHLKGKKKVPDVILFYENGKTLDKLPSKLHKPKSYYKYVERTVNGKLIVYLREQSYSGGTSENINSPGYTKGGMGLYRFWLRLPNGEIYKINKTKNMKNIIIPYLKNCAEFINEYKGNFETDEKSFVKMIKLYNSLCN
ncbi:MAG: hypothetical protein HRT68_10920 [Flavobacteriaceae bacterium]|nr:hypothetical protein [Flavobacteriaceae bacterium]